MHKILSRGIVYCLTVFTSPTARSAAVATLDDCPAHLPRDRYLSVFGTSCYTFQVSRRRDFRSAERECESRLGHLVIIRDAATQEFLYHTLRHHFRFSGLVWIGLTDQWFEGHYFWVDGELRSPFSGWILSYLPPSLSGWMVSYLPPSLSGWIVSYLPPSLSGWMVSYFAPLVSEWMVSYALPSLGGY